MHAQLFRPFQTQLRDTVMKIHLTGTQLCRFYGSLWDFPEIENSPLVVQQIYGEDDIISIPLDKNLWSLTTWKRFPSLPNSHSRRLHPPESSESNRIPDRFRLFSISRYAGPTLMWLDDFFPSRSLTFHFYELSTTRAAAAESERKLECATRSASKYHFRINNKICFRKWNVMVNLRSHVLMSSPEKGEVCDENLIKRLLLVCARG